MPMRIRASDATSCSNAEIGWTNDTECGHQTHSL
jgi:hypothetical protein